MSSMKLTEVELGVTTQQTIDVAVGLHTERLLVVRLLLLLACHC